MNINRDTELRYTLDVLLHDRFNIMRTVVQGMNSEQRRAYIDGLSPESKQMYEILACHCRTLKELIPEIFSIGKKKRKRKTTVLQKKRKQVERLRTLAERCDRLMEYYHLHPEIVNKSFDELSPFILNDICKVVFNNN